MKNRKDKKMEARINCKSATHVMCDPYGIEPDIVKNIGNNIVADITEVEETHTNWISLTKNGHIVDEFILIDDMVILDIGDDIITDIEGYDGLNHYIRLSGVMV